MYFNSPIVWLRCETQFRRWLQSQRAGVGSAGWSWRLGPQRALQGWKQASETWAREDRKCQFPWQLCKVWVGFYWGILLCCVFQQVLTMYPWLVLNSQCELGFVWFWFSLVPPLNCGGPVATCGDSSPPMFAMRSQHALVSVECPCRMLFSCFLVIS